MKLFLVSSTITQNLVPYFEELIGKSIKGLKVAFIPDAADGVPEEDKSWVETQRDELINLHNWDIKDYKLKNLKVDELESLANFDVIYVNGGFSGYLANLMRSSGFEKILPSLLAKGVTYVGSSGGAMVLSKVQDAASWYLGESEPDAINVPGLGYIDFQIYPHATVENSRLIKENCKPDLTYYLMQNGSAIAINDGVVKLCGDGIEKVN